MNREKLKPKVSCSNAKIWGLWKEYQLCSHFLNAILITGLDNRHNKIVMARRKDVFSSFPRIWFLSVAFSITSHSAVFCNLKNSGTRVQNPAVHTSSNKSGTQTQILPCPPFRRAWEQCSPLSASSGDWEQLLLQNAKSSVDCRGWQHSQVVLAFGHFRSSSISGCNRFGL